MASWYPAEYISQPYYPRVFKYVDRAPLHLNGDRLAFWTKARDAALAMWKPGQISFRRAFNHDYDPGFLTLDVTDTQDGTTGQAWFGALPPDATIPAPGVGWAHIDTEWFEQQFLSNIKRELIEVIAHEVGHTLGFGHGGTGIMSSIPGGDVNDEEIAALRAYWKT